MTVILCLKLLFCLSGHHCRRNKGFDSTKRIVNFVGGQGLNSVLVTSIVAVLTYVCTYVEVPTALALIEKGMGLGATLAYLLGGPGLSLPSIIMLSGVFKPRLL